MSSVTGCGSNFTLLYNLYHPRRRRWTSISPSEQTFLPPVNAPAPCHQTRIVLHSGMQHYTYLGVRTVTPTIRDLGALICFSDMQWDQRSNTVCVYIGNNFFLGTVVTFSKKLE